MANSLTALVLDVGKGGRARIVAAGGGKLLDLPDLPAPRDITVQLRRTDNPDMCWAATHRHVKRNTARVFLGRGD